MTRGLLDTSVFIARENRSLSASSLPDQLAVSVVTHAELSAGVLAATDLDVRARRLVTLMAVAEMNPIPIDLALRKPGLGSGSTWPLPGGAQTSTTCG